MNSSYYRTIFEQHDINVRQLENRDITITGKKRKYEDAMGYSNDYEVVQDPSKSNNIVSTGNWIDAYSEHLISCKSN
jgi:hypothetical protein